VSRGPRPAGRIVSLLAGVAGLVLLVGLGVAAVVAGEADDSPGLQGIGVLLVLGALVLGVRALRRARAGRQ
jgi:drug/metabolite transporter (DMT)-like permease